MGSDCRARTIAEWICVRVTLVAEQVINIAQQIAYNNHKKWAVIDEVAKSKTKVLAFRSQI